jgi:hypothetical protein
MDRTVGSSTTDICDAVPPSDGSGRILLVINNNNEFYPDEAVVHLLSRRRRGASRVLRPAAPGSAARETAWVVAENDESVNGHVYGLRLGVLRPN